MSSQLKLAPPYTLGRSGSGAIKIELTSVKETNHVWFHFVFCFHCISPSVAGGDISVWQACRGLFREREVVHLYARGVDSTGPRRAQLSGKVGRARSPQQLAGAHTLLCRHWGMGRWGGDARARKKQKAQIDTTEAKLWKTNRKGYRRMS